MSASVRYGKGNRSGSALLVVLGMLSFMVISAVAFSIYMRQGRLPSSFLRQRILARQLVKAGLAHAMSEIDSAIGNAKYPGMNDGNSSPDQTRNYWKNRVFMGHQTGVSGNAGCYSYIKNRQKFYSAYADDDDDPKKGGLSQQKTVSTLTFEGLAYLPPPLVNTVRYWSRRTPTAQWEPLDYDTGRYAYTAINVSDYFDINRLRANVMRDSSPSNRISLAFLFEETENHTGWGNVKPKDFDAAMKKVADDKFGPLVSLADYNMALCTLGKGGALASSGFVSPFCKQIEKPTDEFYGDNGAYEDNAIRQKFVTGSWYPGSNVTVQVVLSHNEVPPFRNGSAGIRNIKPGLLPLMKDDPNIPVFQEVKQYLNLAERAALKDYVDEDNVPTSLAMPTLEKVPMLTGLLVQPLGFKPQIAELEAKVETKDKKRTTYRAWKLAGFDNLAATVKASAVFPFKRSSALSGNANYDVQVLLKAYLVASDCTLFDNKVRSSNGNLAYRPQQKNDWRTNGDGLAALGVCSLSLFGSGSVTVKAAKNESDALIDVGPFNLTAANSLFERALFGWKTVEEQDDNGTWQPVEDESGYDNSRFKEVSNGMTFYYLDKDGKPQEVPGTQDKSLRWQYLVWVRILDGNDTVDMFPATLRDDDLYNGFNSDVLQLASQLGEPSGDPIVPWAGSTAFDLSQSCFMNQAGVATGSDVPPKPLVAYCNDPRYNWAPEDWWFDEQATDVKAQDWFNQQVRVNGCNGADLHPNDIFQFVSNQGYLQSIGELEFLPIVRKSYNDFTKGNAIGGNFFAQINRYDGVRRTQAGNEANKDFMWNVRCGFGPNADWQHGDEYDVYRWNVVDTKGGVTVSPFAEPELMMAALANTPYDYSVAAEQEQENDKDLEKNIDLCFSAREGEATIEWAQLQEIAKRIRAHALAGDPWEEWDDWYKSDFFGQAIGNLHDVDRKFLFSYWKPCFGDNQQLFLIFVRAEPTVIGGDNSSHTPSQLGARAVALVWREPSTTLSPNGDNPNPPHKMRILFYHQFE